MNKFRQLILDNTLQGKTVLESNDGLYPNITLNDIQLAEAYYPILIGLARHKRSLTYGELLDKAKKIYPDKKYVQNAIPVSTGRKLDVVRIFTIERNLPDVTSLIINQNNGECGKAYTDNFDPTQERMKVYSFDWSNVSTEFDMYIAAVEKNAQTKQLIKRPEALEIMAKYYSENKKSLPKSIRKNREEIINLLMKGFGPNDAFSIPLNNE